MDEAPGARSPEADDDALIVAALKRGDEQAFVQLVDENHASMVRVARAYVATDEAADEVARDAWIGVLRGLDRFEARSTLRTWVFAILISRAMTKGGRDARSVSFAALEREGSSVDPSRFVTSGRWSGWWHAEDAATPLPEPVVVADESRSVVDAAIAALPPNQRLVVTLRDVRGFTAVETTRLLGVTEANERVLLHRARTRVRAAVETYAHERAGTEP